MNFSKILLVLKREYITRVRSKSFLLSTILTPVALLAFGAIMIWIVSDEPVSERVVGVADRTEILYPKLSERNADRYQDLSDIEIDSMRTLVLSGSIDGYLILDQSHIDNTSTPELITAGGGGISFVGGVRDDLREVIREERLSKAEVSPEIREIFETRIGLNSRVLTEDGDEKDDAVGFMSAVGFVLGLLIFIGLFGYGAILMRSVIEEKTNRIVEVIASSIKPIELLIGKVIGVCLLGFTQFAAWVIIYVGISIAAVPIAGMVMQDRMSEMTEMSQNNPEVTEAMADAGFDPASLEMLSIDPMIFVYFFIFFVFGFLMYASLFAAVGSAVDSEQDTQQFMPILMIPIFLGYFFNTRVMVEPDSTLAVIASIFPLTSPINMITRIAVSDVPMWEILASIVLLVLSFFGMMWVSAKIYRVGILMYGKKATWGELAKWVRQN